VQWLNLSAIKQVVKVISHKAASPPLHSAHPSPETKQHLDLLTATFAKLTPVSSGMPQHVILAKNCSFAWMDLDPYLTHASFSPPKPTTRWYKCVDMAHHYIILRCLHSYTITLSLVPQSHNTWHHNVSPYHPIMPTQLYHNVLLVLWISSTHWN